MRGEGGEPLRLDLVSPLPPVRSGIADYAADLLEPLAERAEVRLARLPDQPLSAALAERFPVVDLAEVGSEGRLPLYQMGNNDYHRAVHAKALERPGVMTLHDLVLHHFLIGRTYRDGDLESYRRALEYDHGWIGAAAAAPLRWPGAGADAAQFALPARRRIAGAQRGVLVHSAWAARELAAELPGLAVAEVPMAVPLGAAAEAGAGRAFRRRHRLPEAAPLVGSFGFQTPIKRTEKAIEALAEPALAGVHLVVAGEVAPTLDLEAAARAAGVAERVHLLGFLPFDQLEAAIAACDLCLNLRYPTAGETSASLLRVLAVGRPVLVSEHAQSAELDCPAAVPVPLGEGEVEALAALAGELLGAPERLAQLGRAGRRYVAERCDPAAAADAVVAACRRFAGREPLDPGPAEPPPPTSLAWSTLPGELEVAGAERPWPAGERRRLRIRLRNLGPARWLAAERPAGGVAIEVKLLRGGEDLRAGEGWLGLPFDLDPGGEHHFELGLRRPFGELRLEVLPHVLDSTGFHELGGPVWSAEI